MELEKPAYITIVEGPPPDFRNVNEEWLLSAAEGKHINQVALCEMRAFNGPKLVERWMLPVYPAAFLLELSRFF